MVEQSPFSPREQTMLAAAVRVVAGSGLRGLTHRAVDREAGLPEGSCSAYMRTRLALLTALTRYVADRFAADIADLAHRVEQHPEDPDYAVRETSRMLQSWLLEPELLLTRLELSIEGSRQPEIAQISQAQSRALTDIVEHAMDAAAAEHGRTRAITLIAAVDGILLRALREDPERRTPFMRESLELLMTALVGSVGRPREGTV